MVASVYLITNLVNGKTYVGVTKRSLRQRFTAHVYVAMRAPKTYLHRAIAKYGAGSFFIEPLASCLDAAGAVRAEKELIRSLAPEYNQTNGGEFTLGRRFSDDTKEKIAAKHRGMKSSPEAVEKNRAATKARWEDPAFRAAALAGLARGRVAVDQVKRRALVAEACRTRVWTDESRAKLSQSRLNLHLSASGRN